MAGLEGTVKTPVGPVKKKTALIIGAAAVGVGGIVWWRERNGTGSTVTTDATATGDIDPATGFVYGTPEDLAALASQGGDLSSVGGVTNTGGGGGQPTGGIGNSYATNGQWVQAVIQFMTDNSLVEDATQLSAALGAYITGAFVDPNGPYPSLIQQAIAVQGYPPIAGSNGYPPAINTQPSNTTTPPPVVTPPPVKTTPPPVKTTPPPVKKPLPKRRYVIAGVFHTNNPTWYSTLSGIANHTGRTVSQLASYNHITNVNLIHPNQKIWADPATGFSGEVRITK